MIVKYKCSDHSGGTWVGLGDINRLTIVGPVNSVALRLSVYREKISRIPKGCLWDSANCAAPRV
jgi:hypothetical protein